jgi:cytochrome c-type biogenesis protein CcmH/NrfG
MRLAMLILSAIVLTLSIGANARTPVNAAYRNAVSIAQQNQNSISGHVSDDQRSPVRDLRVELLNEVDSVLQTTKTDGSGGFIFRKLSDGTFHIRVLTQGTNYVSQTVRVEVVRPLGFGGLVEQVDIVLRTNVTTSNNSTPGVVFVQEVPDAARKLYDKAVTQLKKSEQQIRNPESQTKNPEQQSEGITSLKQALEIFPTYFDALDLLGTQYIKQQQYEPAVATLRKALDVNPRAQSSLFAIGVGQYHLKQLPAALDSLRNCVSLNSKSINAQLWLGIVLKALSKLDEAEASFKKANELAESKVPEPHWQLALLLNQLKRYDEAADELELFLKVAPDAQDIVLIRKLIKKLRDQARAKSSAPQFSASAQQGRRTAGSSPGESPGCCRRAGAH